MARILVISDPHLSPTHGFFWANWRRACEVTNRLAPDAVIVSGDLCLNGPDSDDEVAPDFVSAVDIEQKAPAGFLRGRDVGIFVIHRKRGGGRHIVRTGLTTNIDIRETFIRPFHLCVGAGRGKCAEGEAEHGSFFQNDLLLFEDPAATDTSGRPRGGRLMVARQVRDTTMAIWYYSAAVYGSFPAGPKINNRGST